MFPVLDLIFALALLSSQFGSHWEKVKEMEKSCEGPEDDRVSLRSNGKMSPNGSVRETQGLLKTIRRSFKKAPDKSPVSPRSKGLKVTGKEDAAGEESESASFLSPPSPSEYNPCVVGQHCSRIFPLIKKTDDNESLKDSKNWRLLKRRTLKRKRTLIFSVIKRLGVLCFLITDQTLEWRWPTTIGAQRGAPIVVFS